MKQSRRVYYATQEGSHSGLVRTLGKRVCRKAPRVRIPHPPQNKEYTQLILRRRRRAPILLCKKVGFERQKRLWAVSQGSAKIQQNFMCDRIPHPPPTVFFIGRMRTPRTPM